MKAKNIHSVDSLERELYRLRLEIKSKEKQIDDNLDYLQENWGALLVKSLTCNPKIKSGHKTGFFESVIKEDSMRFAFSKVADHIAGRTIEGIDELISRIISKKP